MLSTHHPDQPVDDLLALVRGAVLATLLIRAAKKMFSPHG